MLAPILLGASPAPPRPSVLRPTAARCVGSWAWHPPKGRAIVLEIRPDHRWEFRMFGEKPGWTWREDANSILVSIPRKEGFYFRQMGVGRMVGDRVESRIRYDRRTDRLVWSLTPYGAKAPAPRVFSRLR